MVARVGRTSKVASNWRVGVLLLAGCLEVKVSAGRDDVPEMSYGGAATSKFGNNFVYIGAKAAAKKRR